MIGNLKTNFRSGFFLLCLMFFIIFCLLGSWQVHRYYYKKSLLEMYQARLTQPAKTFAEIKKMNDVQFYTVKISGKYVNKLTVLIPKPYQGKEGFEVLTPVQLKGDHQLLLVDRGWIIKAGAALPVIEPQYVKQSLTGYLKLINEYQFILGNNILQKNPMVMQKIDLKEIAQATHEDFYPFVLRLNAKESHGFVRDWNMISVVPARHLAYALQWFGLALVVLIGYIATMKKRS